MMASSRISTKIPASAGIGLRFPHHQAVVESLPPVGWLEVHSENYMGGGIPLRWLEAAREHYPLSLHGVGLSLGSADGLDPEHLKRLKTLMHRVNPGLVSDHLSWSVVGGTYLADLIPLPLTEESLRVVCRNVCHAQDVLRVQILVENPSSYLTFHQSHLSEWEFLSALIAHTGCGLLCDINNIYVSCSNHGWIPHDYLAALPASAVQEIHLAGHSSRATATSQLLIDDHGSPVPDGVWQLYREALGRFGPVPTLIEWDTNIPTLETLVGEAAKAQTLIERAEARHAQFA